MSSLTLRRHRNSGPRSMNCKLVYWNFYPYKDHQSCTTNKNLEFGYIPYRWFSSEQAVLSLMKCCISLGSTLRVQIPVYGYLLKKWLESVT